VIYATTQSNNSFNRSGISLDFIRRIGCFSQLFPPGQFYVRRYESFGFQIGQRNAPHAESGAADPGTAERERAGAFIENKRV
jgi:hypothetical protein